MTKFKSKEFLKSLALILIASTVGQQVCAAKDFKNNGNLLQNFFPHDRHFDFQYNLHENYFNDENVIKNYLKLIKSGQLLGHDFFNEWQLIERSVDNKARDLQCFQQLNELVQGYATNDATSFAFFDSWGKFPAGILKGHFAELGNFDECVDIKKVMLGSDEIVGKYCFAKIPIDSSSSLTSLDINIAICMPAACSAAEFDIFLKVFLENLLNINVGMNVSLVDDQSCTLREKERFVAIDWFAVAVLATLGAAMLFSSSYDYVNRAMGTNPHPLLCAFSVPANLSQLLRINANTKSANVVPCLNGIRCLSLVWVIIGHALAFMCVQPHMNTFDILDWARTAISMFYQKAAFSVDSFFFLSGFLLSFITLREMDRNNGKLNVPRMLVHRILRLTPMLALAILVYSTLYPAMANGPVWSIFSSIHSHCIKNWWVTLLYVQNYVQPEKMCLGHTWYLAVDMQLYIISPIFLIMLHKWKKRGVAIITIFATLCAACLFTTMVVNDYVYHTNGLAIAEPEVMNKTYKPTHLRASPWFVGLLFGYFMHKHKHRRMTLPKVWVLLGWLICGALICTILFTFYPQAQVNGRTLTSLEEAFFWSLGHIAWPLALCWIVFTCVNGYSGPINGFLSSPLWQPLARLSYCMYLWHVYIEGFNAGRVKTNTHFSHYDLTLKFWSDLGWTILLSTVMHLAFEAPLINIEKLLLPNSRKTTATSSTSSACDLIKSNKLDEQKESLPANAYLKPMESQLPHLNQTILYQN